MHKTIECIDCGQEFEFDEGEQAFFKTKGLEPPKRCKLCRAKKRAEKQRSSGNKDFHSQNRYTKPRSRY